MASPGFKDWVLVANPGLSAITYNIRVAGKSVRSGVIQPRQNVTPTFPGLIAGPVEVITSGPAIASQRILSN